ncbi:MAG: CoA ester lyase [Oscillospiraceae bacterium]|nr:CoA ester lyase [Oscillospiraceae bacterium]
MEKINRSFLFIPANNPGMIQNAFIFDADVIIFDLEDAVSFEEKDSARILLREFLKINKESSSEIIVRINSLETSLGLLDMEEISNLNVDAFLIPKATKRLIKASDEFLNKNGNFKIKLIPLIETSFGVETAQEIVKSSNRVNGILLGGEDLATDLGVKRTKKGDEIFYARTKMASLCRAFKINCIDTPFTDVNDFEGLKDDALFSKNLGFTGKACINPRQIEIVNEIFSPSDEEIERSLRILDALENSPNKGVFSLDGHMIDAPIISRAKNVVEKAKRLRII